MSENQDIPEVDPNALPGDKVDREGNDEIAAQAFTVACGALAGPGGAVICNWFTHGGGEWVLEGIMSLLPESWKAEGAFTWIDTVIDPIRSAAIRIWKSEYQAAGDAYRLMLESRGHVSPSEKTPTHLRWDSVRKRIDYPFAGNPYPPDDFQTWVYIVAQRDYGMGEGKNLFVGPESIIIRSAKQCAEDIGNTGIEKFFCIDLKDTKKRPSEESVKRVAEGLQNALNYARLVPMKKALSKCLDAAQVAADKASAPILDVKFGPTLRPQMGPTDRDVKARNVLLSVWEEVTNEKPSKKELQIVQAIARFEGAYGEGKAKNNWGGVQCPTRPPCPSGCLEYTDKHADGSEYQGCLKVYATPEDGAKHLIKLVTIKRPSVWGAMKRGDAGAVASAMRETSYHETAPSLYAKAIHSNAKTIAKKLEEPLTVSLGPTKAQEKLGNAMVPLAIALAGLWAWRKRK